MSDYKKAGVDIDKAHSLLDKAKPYIKSTYTKAVLSETGSFGGLFSLKDADIRLGDGILVASIDGVGTKTEVARLAESFFGIGRDIVSHCVNDILIQGARPLFFLDYFASSSLEEGVLPEIIRGAADVCREVNCAILGGETAEMPGVYNPNSFDVVGAIIGLVFKENLLPRMSIEEGQAVLGLRSSGLHTNGYSMARRILLDGSIDVREKMDKLDGRSILEALLEPHKCYFNKVYPLIKDNRLKALAHITGGGFYDNIPRVLSEGIGAIIDSKSWEVPEIFRIIIDKGDICAEEAYRAFNLGIGMIAVTSEDMANELLKDKDWLRIGYTIKGTGVIIIGLDQ